MLGTGWLTLHVRVFNASERFVVQEILPRLPTFKELQGQWLSSSGVSRASDPPWQAGWHCWKQCFGGSAHSRISQGRYTLESYFTRTSGPASHIGQRYISTEPSPSVSGPFITRSLRSRYRSILHFLHNTNHQPIHEAYFELGRGTRSSLGIRIDWGGP